MYLQDYIVLASSEIKFKICTFLIESNLLKSLKVDYVHACPSWSFRMFLVQPRFMCSFVH